MNIDIKRGLSLQQVEESRKKYGVNMLTPPPTTPWWRLYLEKFTDPIIIILLVATVISLIFGVIHGNFVESVGIICAILIATGVGFYQEWDAQKKFDAMKSTKDFEPVKVKRDGAVVEIPKNELVVGDVVILAAGDEIPADIELFTATELKVNESSMTGESVAVTKHPINYQYTGSGFAPNLVLRGTVIEQGLGEGYVVKVGDATEIGKTTRQAFEETKNKTPLEEKLHELAGKINIAAFSVAGLMFVILNIVHWINNPFTLTLDTLLTIIQFLMGAVVVIIVAVPEGLPLSVTLALAFSMKTMAKEHNLVKKMHACETIGAVNLIFTDKTGTLTQNSMSVMDKDTTPENEEVLNIIGAINSTANWSKDDNVIGNPTEGAILKDIGREKTYKIRGNYQTLECIPFSSSYKYMVTYAKQIFTNEKICVIKGAPEVISKIIGVDSFLTMVGEQQERGRRAISAAVIDLSVSYNTIAENLRNGKPLTGCKYIGTWFIEDPVRKDVPHAIEKCYKAGIDVIMMTGDNIRTGSEIARAAGLKDIWAVEANEFFTQVDAGGHPRAFPNVVARCTPIDKLD
ncbi:MAG: HAD-IC family P-type ATPase, partial [Bacteroidia bacterium]|nr:HAD-IC family P-type ATPase [Bacteroidia bacterium]